MSVCLSVCLRQADGPETLRDDYTGLLHAGLTRLTSPFGKKKLKEKKLSQPRNICLERTKAGDCLALTNTCG